MPVNGEKLEELLSGFIDGELNQTELHQVEELLRSDPAIQYRVDELRKQSLAVRELGKVLGSQPRTYSLAQVVIARAQQQAIDANLPPNHHVRIAVPASKRKKLSVSMVASVLALAASLLLIVALPELTTSPKLASSTAPNETQIAGGDLNNSPAPVVENSNLPIGEYVGQADNSVPPITYVLVVDIEVTAEAWNANVLNDIWASAGIQVTDSVVVDPSVTQAIDNSLMVVTPPSQQVEQKFLHVVRADMKQIDVTLRNIWKDKVRFPRVTLNVAIDTRADLVRQVLRSMKGNSTISSFAAPVATEDAQVAAHPSPFVGSAGGVKYVSSSDRARGWNASATLLKSSKDATVLIVAHIVE